MSNARTLSDMRLPLQSYFGGLPPDFLSGLDWYCAADNTIVVLPGVAAVPNNDGSYSIVTLPAAKTITIPTAGAGTVRYHLWFKAGSDGLGDIGFDNSVPGANYAGNAFKHGTFSGHRYIGSVQLGTGLNPLRQRCYGNKLTYMGQNNGAPNQVFTGAITTTATGVGLDTICPSTAIAVNLLAFNTGTSTRFAPSIATCGYTANASLFTNAIQGDAANGNIELAVGEDRRFQVAGVQAGSVNILVTGYSFRR